MSRIFSHSWLTICVVASRSCLQGFLDPIDRRAIRTAFGLIGSEEVAIEEPLYLRIATLDDKPADVREAWQWPLDFDLSTSHWNRRGWVFQEKYLSPQKLFFGASMVHFQHENVATSENGCIAAPDLLKSISGDSEYIRQFLSQETIRTAQPFTADLWYDTIERFSRNEFTQRLDCFPALSGLARIFKQVTSYRYVAGLWEEDIHCGLLWVTQGPSSGQYANLRQLIRAIERSPTSAPSWS